MPELPEVENVKLSLMSVGSVGQRFAGVDLNTPSLRTPLRPGLKKKLPGQSLISIQRRAKFLLFETEDFFIVNHLGMTGTWRTTGAPEKHDHVIFHFNSGFRLVYNDPRRFGLLELVEKGALTRHAWLKSLGPEPLLSEFDGEYLFKSTRGLKSSIKNLVMDQKRVVGVGNIYASEALYLAGVRPSRPAGRVTRAECDLLVAAIRRVLTDAIQAGGSTIRDYKNTNGQSGQYQDRFQVYGRASEPCRKCATPIQSRMIGGRNTFWCRTCQP